MLEPMYTLTEARAEIARRECAALGHKPWQDVRTISSRLASFWLCECGGVSWKPTAKADA